MEVPEPSGVHRREARRAPPRGNRACAGAIGRLLVVLAAVAMTSLPIEANGRAPALLLFLLGWGVISTAEQETERETEHPLTPPREESAAD